MECRWSFVYIDTHSGGSKTLVYFNIQDFVFVEYSVYPQ